MQVTFTALLWLITYIAWNIITFSLMFIDKRRAQQQNWRIRERALFFCALFWGAAGMLIGMYTFRHKTRHWSFILGIPFLFLMNAVCCYFLWQKGWLI